MSDEKKYTAEDAATAILAKAHEMLSKNELTKANSSHEVENGEEPNNDDAECPAYLAEADIEGSGEKKAKKKDGEAVEGDNEDGPEHEEGMGAEEEKEHDAAENEADEKDTDIVEADEEGGDADDEAEIKESKKVIKDAASDDYKKDEKEDKGYKKEFEKSEDNKGLGKLRKFLENKEDRLEKAEPVGRITVAAPQEPTSITDRMKQKRMITPKEKQQLAYDKQKKRMQKNKKMEKYLGVSPKKEAQGKQGLMPVDKPQEPAKGPGAKAGY